MKAAFPSAEDNLVVTISDFTTPEPNDASRRVAIGVIAAVVVLMLFCISMLAGGVLSPMLEVEVRVSKLDATLLGTPIEFRDQSLYYRSKTVFEVFQTSTCPPASAEA